MALPNDYDLVRGHYPEARGGQVIDIGGSQLTKSLKNKLKKRLIGVESQSSHFLSDSFFSDDKGLAIWKKINQLPNYYQTDHEVELLQRHGDEIVNAIGDRTAIIDLGCGDIRKVAPLLDRLEAAGKKVQYYALDLSRSAIQQNLAAYSSTYQHVTFFGLWGTFEDGLEWSRSLNRPRVFLSLGSIFGNDRFERAVKYLASWARALRPADRILLGIDCCQDKERIWDSYHDKEGIFEGFVRNAFENSNEVMGPWYRDEDWKVDGCIEDEPLVHRFVLRAVNDVVFEEAGINFKKGDEIECYEGFKQDLETMRRQFTEAGLLELGMWESASKNIYEFLLKATESRALKADGPVDDVFWG